jgi:membrane associated rhomboid family serine protease
VRQSGKDTRSGAHPGQPALPWATISLLTLVLTCTLAVPLAGEAESPRALLRRSALLWSQHAYLSAEPEVLIELGRGLAIDERRAKLAALRDAAEVDSPDADERAARQEELDQLTERALASPPPLARSAWIPAYPRATALLVHAFTERDPLGLLIAAPLLALLGALLEGALGMRLTLAAFALGCFAAPLCLLLLAPGSEHALRGSSALSATLLGVACVHFRHSGAVLALPVWDDGIQLRKLGLPLRGLAFAWVAAQLLALARGNLVEHPYPASLIGLALGACAALLVERRLARAPREAPPPAPPEAGSGLLDQARKARARGEDGVALALLRQAVRDQPDDADVIVELWEAARACGRVDVAMPRMLALDQRCVTRGELSPAARHWMRVRDVDPQAQLPPESAIPLAAALTRLRQRDIALGTLRCGLADSGARLSGALALQAIELARALEDPGLVQQAAKVGLALPYLAPELRERLQRELEPAAQAAPVVERRLRRIAVLEALPDRLGERGLTMRLADRTLELAYERIQAISVASIAGEGAEPLRIIDLILNWNALPEEPLHVMRVRGDRFDARLLVGDALAPAEASRVFLQELRANTRAIALPGEESAAAGGPLHLFATLADYEREVLRFVR